MTNNWYLHFTSTYTSLLETDPCKFVARHMYCPWDALVMLCNTSVWLEMMIRREAYSCLSCINVRGIGMIEMKGTKDLQVSHLSVLTAAYVRYGTIPLSWWADLPSRHTPSTHRIHSSTCSDPRAGQGTRKQWGHLWSGTIQELVWHVLRRNSPVLVLMFIPFSSCPFLPWYRNRRRWERTERE